jgi:hypothetical protein
VGRWLHCGNRSLWSEKAFFKNGFPNYLAHFQERLIRSAVFPDKEQRQLSAFASGEASVCDSERIGRILKYDYSCRNSEKRPFERPAEWDG